MFGTWQITALSLHHREQINNSINLLNYKIMKNNIKNNSLKAMASFFVSGLVMLTVWCAENASSYQDETCTHTSLVSKVSANDNDMAKLNEINGKIAKLEQQKASMNKKLQEVKAERNKNYGMVAGMYSQPSQGQAEINNLESKISNMNHQIAALKKNEKFIADKHKINIQHLAQAK